MNEVIEFDEKQRENISDLFNDLYERSIKVHSLAQAVKLAKVGEDYQDEKIDEVLMASWMDMIIECNTPIFEQCVILLNEPNKLIQEGKHHE